MGSGGPRGRVYGSGSKAQGLRAIRTGRGESRTGVSCSRRGSGVGGAGRGGATGRWGGMRLEVLGGARRSDGFRRGLAGRGGGDGGAADRAAGGRAVGSGPGSSAA